MTENHPNLNDLNLWDLHVTSVRLFEASDVSAPVYNFEIEVDIRPGTLAADSPRQTAWFRFYECCEFGAGIDILMWAMVGPELAEGHATLIDSNDPPLTRYTLELRAPGGAIEIVARSFTYEGPNIAKIAVVPSEAMKWTWNDLQKLKRNE